MSHANAARAADSHYPSTLHPGMFFKKRNACDSIAMDTPRTHPSEITTDPYAAEGKRLAHDDHLRRKRAFAQGTSNDYFEWRQSIGNAYYDGQDRLNGRVAANDNHLANRKVAA